MHDKAVAAYTAQDWAESEKYYVELSRAVPSNVEPWFKLGNIYARTDRPELAIRAYRECVIRNPRHAKAWHNMGIIQLRQARGSFTQLQQFVNESNPLYEKSARISSGIETLIESTD
jgi:tetratricopeptide (TPR) repeat protein